MRKLRSLLAIAFGFLSLACAGRICRADMPPPPPPGPLRMELVVRHAYGDVLIQWGPVWDDRDHRPLTKIVPYASLSITEDTSDHDVEPVYTDASAPMWEDSYDPIQFVDCDWDEQQEDPGAGHYILSQVWHSTGSHDGIYRIHASVRAQDGNLIEAEVTTRIQNLLVQPGSLPHTVFWGGPGSPAVTFTVPLSESRASDQDTRVETVIRRVNGSYVKRLSILVPSGDPAVFTWDGTDASDPPRVMEKGPYLFTEVDADHGEKTWYWTDDQPDYRECYPYGPPYCWVDNAWQDSKHTRFRSFVMDSHDRPISTPVVKFVKTDGADDLFSVTYVLESDGGKNPDFVRLSIIDPDGLFIRTVTDLPAALGQHDLEIKIPVGLFTKKGLYYFLLWGQDTKDQDYTRPELWDKDHRPRPLCDQGSFDVKPDLVIQDLPEEIETTVPNEESVGAILVVNDDDDDHNGTADKDDPGVVAQEDDLVCVKLAFQPASPTQGQVTIRTMGDKIRIWADPTRQREIPSWTAWDLATQPLPSEVYVEGIRPSTAWRDEGLILNYSKDHVDTEDKVLITVLKPELVVLPDDPTEIGADEHRYTVVACATYPNLDDPENPLPIEAGGLVDWTIAQGQVEGILAPQITTTDENGLACSVLNTSIVAGAEYVVKGRLTEYKILGHTFKVTQESVSETLTVIPDVPSVISYTKSKESYHSDETDTVTFEATVRDAQGNLVDDGTDFSWLLDESTTDLTSFDTYTHDGKATATLQAPMIPFDQINEGEAGLAAMPCAMPVARVSGTIVSTSGVLDIGQCESAELTCSVDAVDGTPVFWTTSNGSLGGSNTLESYVYGGQSTTTLSSQDGFLGPVVVTATVGDRFLYWQGEFTSSSGIAYGAEHNVLVGGATADGSETITWPSGRISTLSYCATTPIRVKGPPNASLAILLSASGILPIESYNFDSMTEGVVPGQVSGRDMTVIGAALDQTESRTGAASLLFDGNDSASIAASPQFDFTADLSSSLWVCPDGEPAAATLLSKGVAWKIESLTDGRVKATIKTTDGEYSATTTNSLQADRWSCVKLRFSYSELIIALDSDESYAYAPGTIETNGSPIVLGTLFRGHIDDLAFVCEGEIPISQILQVTGLDADGRLQLDEQGEGTLHVALTGTLPDSDCLDIAVGISAEEDWLSTASLQVNMLAWSQGKPIIRINGKKALFYTKDCVLSFLGGDPESGAGIASNVAGGCLIVGNIGSLVKNLWRMVACSETKPNYPEMVLSGLGLILDLVAIEGPGEVANIPIGIARTIVCRVKTAVTFCRSIAKYLKEAVLVRRLITEGDITFFKYLSKDLALHGGECLEALSNSVKSIGALGSTVKLSTELGLPFWDTIKVLKSDPRAIAKLVESLDALSDEARAALKASDAPAEALKDLAVLSKKYDAGLIDRVLENAGNICSATYDQAALLRDLEQLRDVQGLDHLMKCLKIGNAQAKGFRYELECAAEFSRQGRNVEVLSKVVRATDGTMITDIDLVVDGIHYQAKSSTAAFGYGSKGLNKAKRWVKAALNEVGGDASKVKYLAPPNTKVPPQVEAFLTREGIEVKPMTLH